MHDQKINQKNLYRDYTRKVEVVEEEEEGRGSSSTSKAPNNTSSDTIEIKQQEGHVDIVGNLSLNKAALFCEPGPRGRSVNSPHSSFLFEDKILKVMQDRHYKLAGSPSVRFHESNNLLAEHRSTLLSETTIPRFRMLDVCREIRPLIPHVRANFPV